MALGTSQVPRLLGKIGWVTAAGKAGRGRDGTYFILQLIMPLGRGPNWVTT